MRLCWSIIVKKKNIFGEHSHRWILFFFLFDFCFSNLLLLYFSCFRLLRRPKNYGALNQKTLQVNSPWIIWITMEFGGIRPGQLLVSKRKHCYWFKDWFYDTHVDVTTRCDAETLNFFLDCKHYNFFHSRCSLSCLERETFCSFCVLKSRLRWWILFYDHNNSLWEYFVRLVKRLVRNTVQFFTFALSSIHNGTCGSIELS